MKTETFKFITESIDRYGEWFFSFDFHGFSPLVVNTFYPLFQDIFEGFDEEKDYYYIPYCNYHGRERKGTDAIMVKAEMPVWLCCMQAMRDKTFEDFDDILEDMRKIEKDKMGKDSIILY